MVDVEGVLLEALRSSTGLLALLGGEARVYSSLPSSPSFPALRLTLIAGGEDARPWQPGEPLREGLDVQLDAWGGNRVEALALVREARRTLSGLVGPVSGGAVSGLHFTSMFSAPDDDVPTNSGRARDRYISQVEVIVKHAPAA